LCDNGKPENVLRLCAKHGLGIEYQSFAAPEDLHQADAKIAYHRAIAQKEIEKHLHAPYHDLCLGSRNPDIAEITRFYFDYAYRAARELGCGSITVHHGYVPSTSYPENWVRRAADFWKKFFEAHTGDLHIHMENQLEEDPDILLRLIDRVGDERLAVNLDIGHAHCHSRMEVKEWVRQLNGRIQYVHIHQNFGQRDEHLGLADGNIPLEVVLEALEQYAPNATWALECAVTKLEESVAWLKDKGYMND